MNNLLAKMHMETNWVGPKVRKMVCKIRTNFWANPVFQTRVEMTQALNSEQIKSYDL